MCHSERMRGSPLLLVCLLSMSCADSGSPTAVDSDENTSSVPTADTVVASDPTEVTTDVTETTVATTTTPRPTAPVPGFNPPCVEFVDTREPFSFLSEADLDVLQDLPIEPNLTLDVPSVLGPDSPDLQPPAVQWERVPGGVLLGVTGSTFALTEGSQLTLVDADGVTRWTRCLDERIVSVRAAPASTEPTEALVGTTTTRADGFYTHTWQRVGLRDGGAVGPVPGLEGVAGDQLVPLAQSEQRLLLGAVEPPVVGEGSLYEVDLASMTATALPWPDAGLALEARPVYAPSGDLIVEQMDLGVTSVAAVWLDGQWSTDESAMAMARGPIVEFSYDGGTTALVGRNVRGEETWRNADLRDLTTEGFRLGFGNDIAIVAACGGALDGSGVCPSPVLVGVDAALGLELWRIDGASAVAFVDQARSLAYTEAAEAWVMIDNSSGEAIPGQQWPDGTFAVECCGGDETRYLTRDGGVVAFIDGASVKVWYPASAGATGGSAQPFG
jgi:hypothetical protein